ncbi:MAG: Nucleotide-binding protein, PIN domain protein [Parcubacteria group bacterium GW2011_GWC2_45_7]|nr:MAG: Nucleotide-binding protein, PIN domain protein [Parcubacteria group bacterium GW2011_GWC2_45_7]KKU71911.1 MAG: Nucleotide-binding protein, PIN domain protein [Parcubacteria group bacterium GW2011_GWA2_47_26]
MILTIAVDANPILAALLGGYARIILFDPRFSFITTEFTTLEVQRYLPLISEKSGVPHHELEEALRLLPIKVFKRFVYRLTLDEAHRHIGHIDPNDTDILALALCMDAPLWSNDIHFTKIKPLTIKILRTRDFIL